METLNCICGCGIHPGLHVSGGAHDGGAHGGGMQLGWEHPIGMHPG